MLISKIVGAKILSFYCIYLLVMAINGIFECFAFASISMDTPQVATKSNSLHILVDIFDAFPRTKLLIIKISLINFRYFRTEFFFLFLRWHILL